MIFRVVTIMVIVGFSLLYAAQSYTLEGTVKDEEGKGIEGVAISLAKLEGAADTTDEKGAFVVDIPEGVGVAVPYNMSVKNSPSFGIQGRLLQFRLDAGCHNASVAVYRGSGQLVSMMEMGRLRMGIQKQVLPELVSGFYVVQVSIDGYIATLNLISTGREYYIDGAMASTVYQKPMTTTAAANEVVDTVVAAKAGFETGKVAITSYTLKGVAIVLKKEGPMVCEVPEIPDVSDGEENKKLPDPFTFLNGTKLTKKSQWPCRRKEILAMASKYLYGPLPPEPDEVIGKVNSGSIEATVKVGSKSKKLTFRTSGSGDVLNIATAAGISPGGCRTYSMTSGDAGSIRDLYGLSGFSNSIALGWTAQVICLAVASDPDGGIDTNKIMTTGCSGCGKGALHIGAFAEGVDLTVIVESGGGGAASYRMTEWFRHGGGPYQCADAKPQGIDNLEANGVCGSWVVQQGWFKSSPSNVYKIPYDQHLLLASIAPRAVCHVTNQHGRNEWCHLGGTCEALSAWAAKSVWSALGVPEKFGFRMYTESGAPGHCSNPRSATSLANEFFNRIFKGDESAETDVWEANDQDLQQSKDEWKDMWVDWDMETKLE